MASHSRALADILLKTAPKKSGNKIEANKQITKPNNKK